MAYNKTSEERKWNYWKEQEEKKLRELGMEEEKIQKLRQMDREDFLEERRYREHLDEMMQDMDSIKQRDRGRFAQDIRELLDNAAEQFRKSYDALKMRLSLSAEYNTAPQVSETDTNSTESGV